MDLLRQLQRMGTRSETNAAGAHSAAPNPRRAVRNWRVVLEKISDLIAFMVAQARVALWQGGGSSGGYAVSCSSMGPSSGQSSRLEPISKEKAFKAEVFKELIKSGEALGQRKCKEAPAMTPQNCFHPAAQLMGAGNQSQREVWCKQCHMRWLVDPSPMEDLKKGQATVTVGGRQDDAVREEWSSGSPRPQDKHEEPQHTNPDPEFPTAQHPVSGQQVLSAQPEHYTGQWWSATARRRPQGQRDETPAGAGEGTQEGGATEDGDAGEGERHNAGGREEAQHRCQSADASMSSTGRADAPATDLDDGSSRRGASCQSDERPESPGRSQCAGTHSEEQLGGAAHAPRISRGGDGRQHGFLEPLLDEEAAKEVGDAPWACTITTEAQWKGWQAMQLRDEHMREHEKQVSPQFWISSQGGSWKEGQGILPEYAPGARALGVFPHAGEWMKDEHYEEAERSLSRNSRRAVERSMRKMVVAEVYSLPRVTKMAQEMGHEGAAALIWRMGMTSEGGRTRGVSFRPWCPSGVATMWPILHFTRAQPSEDGRGKGNAHDWWRHWAPRVHHAALPMAGSQRQTGYLWTPGHVSRMEGGMCWEGRSHEGCPKSPGTSVCVRASGTRRPEQEAHRLLGQRRKPSKEAKPKMWRKPSASTPHGRSSKQSTAIPQRIVSSYGARSSRRFSTMEEHMGHRGGWGRGDGGCFG